MALDCVIRDEIIWLASREARAHYRYGLVKDTTLVLGPDEMGVLSGREDLPPGHACLWST